MRTHLVLTLLLTALPLAAAQNTQNAPAMSTMQMQMDMHSRMEPMMDDLRRLSGREFDRAFLSMMIPHHESSVEMAQAALPRLRDPLVRAWAQELIDDQQKEIAEMQSELQRLGGVDTARQNRMRQSMTGMAQMLRGAQNADRMFLEMMTPHHGSANEMANLALQNSNDGHVLGLAQRVVMMQADEMHDFKDWLRTRGQG